VPTLQEPVAARNTSDVDADQQLIGESAGGNNLPEVTVLDVAVPDIAVCDVAVSDVAVPDAPVPDVPVPDVPVPNVPVPNVSVPNVPVTNFAVPDVPVQNAPLLYAPLAEVRLDGSVGEKWTSSRVAEEVMVIVFRLWSGSHHVLGLCSNLFISSIDYYTHH